MEVVKYILNNMEKSTNTLIITTRELATKSKTSKQTVIETLKALEEAQIITRKTGAIMIHPKLMHRGKASIPTSRTNRQLQANANGQKSS